MKSVKISNRQWLYLDLIFGIVLFLYPLRHIYWGLDLWDTGYSYANYLYMGMEHMDPMWLFSTYLANAVGHFLTGLPGAGTMAGMNFYTGLFSSALALMGYFFCTRGVGVPKAVAFVGEMAALSLCWCPSASLYNYLTYVFFHGCVILLYQGLTKEKMWCLFAAGVCLGCNVLVRFSNLLEAAMIVAVWVWDILVWLEERKARGGQLGHAADSGTETERTDAGSLLPRNLLRHTLYCLGGYLAALALLFGYIHIRYGMDAYIAGIQRLFAMTDKASDYKATSMVRKMIDTYVINLYWAERIAAIVAAGTVGFCLMEFMLRRTGEKSKAGAVLRKLARVVWCGVAAFMVVWLYVRGFCSMVYYTYGAIERAAVLFLMLTMLIGGVRFFYRGSSKEEKLLSVLVVLVVILTSLGSNNGVYPSINNLFVAAPYMLWEIWRFLKHTGEWSLKGKWVVSAFPAKAVAVAFLALFFFQSAVFGAVFVFAEATGAQNITCVIENNKVLKGMKMSPERAEWIGGLSGYVEENGLSGREVILYGWIPALSYYLQMPSAFNPWSDLDSYACGTMEKALAETASVMEKEPDRRPVILIENQYALYLEEGGEALRERGAAEALVKKIAGQDDKTQLLKEFMETYHYSLTYKNEKFSLYE